MADEQIYQLPAGTPADADHIPFDSDTSRQTFQCHPHDILNVGATSFTGTWAVNQGGTGDTTFTAYSVICGGTTATGPLQNVSGVGTSGQVLTSNGAAALPTWQAAPGGAPGGSNTQLEFNDSAAFAGAAGLTWNKTTLVFSITSNASASNPPVQITGTMFTGGSATTTKPQLLIEPTGTTSTGWATTGTAFGINLAAASTARYIDCQVNGASQVSILSSLDPTLDAGLVLRSTNAQIFFNNGASYALRNKTSGISVVLGGFDGAACFGSAYLGGNRARGFAFGFGPSAITGTVTTMDVGWESPAVGVIAATDGQGSNVVQGWMQDAGIARITADVTNASTTLANLSDLTITLKAGRKYTGRVTLKCNDSVAADGIKIDFNGGSATMTSFWAGAGVLASGGTDTVGTNISTSLAGVINFTVLTGETVIIIELSMVVNAAGTLIIRQAQNSHSAGTLTVELGSYIQLRDSVN